MNKIKISGFCVAVLMAINVFAVTDPNLIGHYKLDGNALDATVNGYDGTIYAATSSDGGIDNGCYDFNGVNTAIVYPDPAAENRFPAGGPITISTWVKVREYHSDETVIAGMDSGRNIKTRASIRMNAAGNLYYFAHTTDGPRYFYGPVVEKNTWCHLAAIQTFGSTKLFINGVKVAETNDIAGLIGPMPAAGFGPASLPFHDISVSFVIGSWTDYLRIRDVIFNGLIDDVRFYNRALNDSEINDLYVEFTSTTATPDSGLVFWNRLGSFDEVLNSEIGGDGTFNAGIFVPGKFGEAVELNMQQECGVTFPIDALRTSKGCYEFWAKLSDMPSSLSGGANPCLIGWVDDEGGSGILMYLTGNDGQSGGGLCARSLFGYIGTGYFGSWNYSSAIGGGNPSEWHHYAVTWNNDGITGVGDGTRQMAIFVDGQLNSLPKHVDLGGGVYYNWTPANLALLSRADNANGRVAYDNIKIWNYDRTDFSDRFEEDAGSVPPEDDIDAGLQLYYPFSTDNGAVATDASGEGHNGAVVGAQWQDGGPNGGYLHFDGNADYVNAGTDVNFPAWEQYTVSVWFLHDGGGDNSGYGQKLIDKCNWSSDFRIALMPNNYTYNGYPYCICKDVSASTSIGVYGYDTVAKSDNTWHHFVVIRDGTNLSCWTDGVLTGSKGGMFTVNNSASLYIGNSASPDGYQRRGWSGFIDEVRVYNRAVSDTEVELLYQTDSTPPEDDLDAGLKLYYPFSADDGAVANDASGEGHHGAITGAQWQDAGPNGGCLYFDGNADYVNAGTAVNFPAWDQYSVSVWFLHDGGGDNTGYGQKIIDKTSIGHDVKLGIMNDHKAYNGYPSYICYESRKSIGVYGYDTVVKGSNTWHHFVVIRDGTNLSCWTDGVLTGSKGGMFSVNSSSPLYIGYSASSDAFQRRCWSGFIDEVRIYDRTITSNEVNLLYQSGVVEVPPDPDGPDSGLILWNRLGSDNEVLNSDIGDDGAMNAGSFVPGKFGDAIELNFQEQYGVTFPVASMATSVGCIEFWAKLSDLPAAVPFAYAAPALLAWRRPGVNSGVTMYFVCNDGAGNGGIGARTEFGSTGTGLWRYSWTYSQAIGGGDVSDWHHYAMIWNKTGISGVGNGTRKVAVFVDGVLNSTHLNFNSTGERLISDDPTIEFGLLQLSTQSSLMTGRVAFDNFKVWNYDKTDFSDRFVENAGFVPSEEIFSLTVADTKGAADPVNGEYSYELGTEVIASVPAFVIDGDTRYVCTGAIVTGNDYVMNGLTNVTMIITNDTSVTWNWQTHYRLDTQTEGDGTLTPVEVWQDEGAVIVLTAAPAVEWIFDRWSGDIAGCTVEGNVITVPMNQTRSIRAVFIPLVVMSLREYALLPENMPLKYRKTSGSWFYSNQVGGLYCDSPAERRSASMMITVPGPGILSFEWEVPGADGVSTLSCLVRSRTRGVKRSGVAETVSVAVPSGSATVRWQLKRATGSAELSAVIRNIVWTPLVPASDPVPVDESVLMQRDFNGAAWVGAADFYRVYAGPSMRDLDPLGAGEYNGTSVPAEAFDALIAAAAGQPFYWRVDSVRRDSFGVDTVNRGALWSMAVLPEGSPEFESSASYIATDLKVGVLCELPAFTFLNGFAGEMRCKTVGRLPSGLRLEVRDGAVYIVGVPKRAGRYTLTLQLSVRIGSRTVMPGTTCELDLTVTGLGDVVGSYDGWLSDSMHGEGTVKMSVSRRGRVTGKCMLNGAVYTFKAPFFDGLSNGFCLVSAVVKQGSVDSFPATFAVGEDGLVHASCVDDPDALLVLTRNRWREDGAEEFLASNAGVYQIMLPASELFPDGGGSAVVTISARGRGRARIVGTTLGGKRFYSSTTLMYVPATEEDPARSLVVIYARPTSATARQRLFGVQEVVVDPEGIEPNELMDLILLNWW